MWKLNEREILKYLIPVLFTLISFPLAAAPMSHQTSDDSQGLVCKGGDSFPLESGDVLSDYLKMLYVKFTGEKSKDAKGNELVFMASKISINGDHLEFENPSLNGSPLHAEQIYCAAKKKNLFGREVCQNALRGTHIEFCKKLGLESPSEDHAQYTYAMKKNIKYYSLDEEGNLHRNYTSSLTGKPYYRTLYRYQCKIPK